MDWGEQVEVLTVVVVGAVEFCWWGCQLGRQIWRGESADSGG